MYNAMLWQTLIENNIKYIINVSVEVQNCYPEHIVYYQIPMKDDNKQSLLPFFDETCKKIDEFMDNKNGNILIHCVFGASRSVTIVCEYIRRKTGKEIEQIISELKTIRPSINPTLQFVKDLHDSENIEQNIEQNII